MKKKLLWGIGTILSVFVYTSCTNESDMNVITGEDPVVTKATGSQIIFEDNFDQANGIPDTAKWTLCTKSGADWARYLSESYDQAYVKDGKLVLVGEKVDGEYKVGGVETLGKVDFKYGRVEVCAKFTKSAQGGWPAIWMMPSAPIYSGGWPDCGEIDIMEKLNHEIIIHNTIHSHYKNTLNMYLPVPSMIAFYKQNEYNVYAVDWTPDALVFSLNGVKTLTYPNKYLSNENVKHQWPFQAPFYIILNQALGGPGTWPGDIKDSELPAIMEVDWVRVTQ